MQMIKGEIKRLKGVGTLRVHTLHKTENQQSAMFYGRALRTWRILGFTKQRGIHGQARHQGHRELSGI